MINDTSVVHFIRVRLLTEAVAQSAMLGVESLAFTGSKSVRENTVIVSSLGRKEAR